MDKEKFFLLSRSIVGALFALTPALTSVFGIMITGEDLDVISDVGDALATAAGGLLVLWARIADGLNPTPVAKLRLLP